MGKLGGHFAPVRVNDTLTLDFANAEEPIRSEHYAFHVSDPEFDAILQRVKAAGLTIGSTPWSLGDGKLAEGKWLQAAGNDAEIPGVW